MINHGFHERLDVEVFKSSINSVENTCGALIGYRETELCHSKLSQVDDNLCGKKKRFSKCLKHGRHQSAKIKNLKSLKLYFNRLKIN